MHDHDESDQFVTLGLDHEVFAVPVELVREILDMRQPFRIPEAPGHLAGLIDVRGHAVPVIDLRLKLGLSPREPTADTRIVVLDVPMDGRSLSLGLIADRVFEVTASIPAALRPPPTSARPGTATTSRRSVAAATASSSCSTSHACCRARTWR